MISHRNARPPTAGFTLIELMITISIAAILLAIGIPSFRYVTSANRASSEINGLLGDMQFARAEAIRQGLSVTVCSKAAASLTCSGSTSWETGWLVFQDSGVIGTVDGTEAANLLKVQGAFSGTDTLTADNTVKFVTFNRDGFALSLPNAGVALTLQTSPVNAQYTRCLSLTIVGALSTQVGGKTKAEGGTC
jgi:type IV fimbrial biogenesis protein FimT